VVEYKKNMENLTWIQKVGNFVSNILLGQTKEIIIRTDQRVKGIEDTISELKISIKGVSDAINLHETSIAVMKTTLAHYGESHSPMKPNENGLRLLKESGFDKQYPLLEKDIFSIIDKTQPRTLYDYEIRARQALEELKDDPRIDPVKDYVVNNPSESLELVFGIASWVIRDKYALHRLKK